MEMITARNKNVGVFPRGVLGRGARMRGRDNDSKMTNCFL